MAEKISVILQDLRSERKKYIEHMIKIFMWRDTVWFTKWRKEIYGTYRDIQMIKGKNKYPESKDIYDNIFGNIEDTFDGRVKWYVDNLEYDNEELSHRNVDESVAIQLHCFISEYTKFISDQLSTDGIVDRAEASDKMSELLDKYNRYNIM